MQLNLQSTLLVIASLAYSVLKGCKSSFMDCLEQLYLRAIKECLFKNGLRQDKRKIGKNMHSLILD